MLIIYNIESGNKNVNGPLKTRYEEQHSVSVIQSNLNSSNIEGSFTMADSNLFLSP